MKKPNILFITSDQQHWSTLGCLNPEVKTPNLDRLANEGMMFTRAYCPNPTCTPTRASLITGQYPSQHGGWALGTKLPEDAHIIGDDLQAAGYRTALVGKAHFQPLAGTDEFPSLEAYPVLQDLEYWKKFHGPFYGFEHVELARNHVDEAHVGQHYALWMEEKGLKDWKKHFRKPTGTRDPQRHKWSLPEEFHYNPWIAEKSIALLESYAQKEEPFFLWSSFFDPHPPYLVPEPWDTLYDPDKVTVPQVTPGEHDKNAPHFKLTQEKKPDFSPWQEEGGSGCHGFHSHLQDKKELARDIAVYYGMITMMDKYIGDILNKLDETGLTDNTLVVFTTDHGHVYGHHGLIGKGAFHYEDLIKVPLLVRLPGQIQAGSKSGTLVSLVDLPPTFLTMTGITIPRTMQGIDHAAVLLGQKPKIRDHVIVENHHQPTTLYAKTYVGKRYKITVYLNHDYGELFDLQEDPEEKVNLWDRRECSDLKSTLLLKLIHADMDKEPVWMPRIAGA